MLNFKAVFIIVVYEIKLFCGIARMLRSGFENICHLISVGFFSIQTDWNS